MADEATTLEPVQFYKDGPFMTSDKKNFSAEVVPATDGNDTADDAPDAPVRDEDDGGDRPTEDVVAPALGAHDDDNGTKSTADEDPSDPPADDNSNDDDDDVISLG